jgi:hypothetical protein
MRIAPMRRGARGEVTDLKKRGYVREENRFCTNTVSGNMGSGPSVSEYRGGSATIWRVHV